MRRRAPTRRSQVLFIVRDRRASSGKTGTAVLVGLGAAVARLRYPAAGCPYRKPHSASEQSRIAQCSFPMIDFFRLLACALTRLFRSRARLEAEILVLRHQLNVLRRRSPKRVAFSSIDRLVFAGMYRLAPGVLDALQILKPETVADPSRAPSPSSPETAPWLHPASRPPSSTSCAF